MTTIFDSSKLPGLRLAVMNVIAYGRGNITFGEEVRIVRQNMVRDLAEKIFSEDKFFHSENIENGRCLEIRADMIVLTTGEYRDLKMTAFKDGQEHGARWAMRMDPLK